MHSVREKSFEGLAKVAVLRSWHLRLKSLSTVGRLYLVGKQQLRRSPKGLSVLLSAGQANAFHKIMLAAQILTEITVAGWL